LAMIVADPLVTLQHLGNVFRGIPDSFPVPWQSETHFRHHAVLAGASHAQRTTVFHASSCFVDHG
jgi:hypothetical protein